jgi:DMSO/TMAO reductase YedYZ molybdopterin-dependent catalytic subunit
MRQPPVPLPAFQRRLHEPRTATAVGRWLGIAFAVCFLTGLWSHLVQHPPGWFDPPATPSWGYRLTQGLHVTTGLASVPLLLAKLWVVYPRLFAWPPVRSLAHALERLAIAVLVAASLFELVTGVLNVAQWYPWPFYFPAAHYAVAWLAVGALCVHLSAKWTVIATRRDEAEPAGAGLSRRRFLATTFGAAGAVVLLTVGQTVRPARRLAVLAPRRPDAGPQRLPVNRTAAQARVAELALDPAYRLRVAGLSLSLPQLEALPQRTVSLPIACVEGWSAGADWTGVPLRDLLDLAGVRPDATVRAVSLERAGLYRSAVVGPHQARHPDTLVALRLRGEPLALDHGHPARLIGPNRPGVQQTKWLAAIEVV